MCPANLQAVREAAAAWTAAIVAPQAADLDRRPHLEFAACPDVTTAWAAVSPDCSYRLVRDALAAAQREICLYIYNATAKHMLDLLRDARDRGVHIRLMFDTMDTRGSERARLAGLGVELKEAPSSGGRRVFTCCHQKFAVIDDASLLLGSANWATTGIPKITVPGRFKKGNREWLVRIDHAGLAAWFKGLFDADWAIPALPAPAGAAVAAPPRGPQVFAAPLAAPPARIFDIRRASGVAAVVTPLVSPDNYFETLQRLIAEAGQSIDIEQQYILATGPKMEALLAALAGRKDSVAIRAIVSPAYRKVGAKDNWELSADTMDAFGLKDRLRAFSLDCYSHLHNKGVIVDRRKVVVSSTNWSENSISRAREAGVLIESADLAGYFADVFDFDWSIAAPAGQVLPNAAALAAAAAREEGKRRLRVHPADLV